MADRPGFLFAAQEAEKPKTHFAIGMQLAKSGRSTELALEIKNLIRAGKSNEEQIKQLMAGYISGDKSGQRAKEAVEAFRNALGTIRTEVEQQIPTLERRLATLTDTAKNIENKLAKKAHDSYIHKKRTTGDVVKKLRRLEYVERMLNVWRAPESLYGQERDALRAETRVTGLSHQDYYYYVRNYLEFDPKLKQLKGQITKCEAELTANKGIGERISTSMDELVRGEEAVIKELRGLAGASPGEVSAPVKKVTKVGTPVKIGIIAAVIATAVGAVYYLLKKDEEKVPKKTDMNF
ncbi:hypothetical protein J4450_04630 [Candidatus Micrarchaeota archaeon]|nr:hypothetical protein [Candidatus Micrarchaeota archaeon]